MEDEAIVQLFFERSQDALVMTAQKYERLFYRIAGNILCDPRDAEEAVEDAYLRLWNSIPPNCPVRFQAYAVKLCRNAALDILRRNHRGKRDNRGDILFSELDACLPSPEEIDARLEEKELAALINRYLRTLDSASRQLFVRRYFFQEPLEALARDLRLSEHTVSARLYRIRKGLKKHLKKEGVAI